MTPPDKGKPPSERRIGARVRVRRDRANDAAELFAASGFAPLYVEHRDDGDVSFWFGKEPDDILYRIVTCIPREFYALQGVLVCHNSSVPSQTGSDH